MDYWIRDAAFQVRVDGELVWSVFPGHMPTDGQICGTLCRCHDVGMVVVNIEVVHSSDYITIELGVSCSMILLLFTRRTSLITLPSYCSRRSVEIVAMIGGVLLASKLRSFNGAV